MKIDSFITFYTFEIIIYKAINSFTDMIKYNFV